MSWLFLIRQNDKTLEDTLKVQVRNSSPYVNLKTKEIQLNSKRGVQAENARLDTNMCGDLNKSYCVRGCSLDCHLQARTAGAGAGCGAEAEAAGTQLRGEHRGREAPEAIAGHAPSPPSHLSTRPGPRTQPVHPSSQMKSGPALPTSSEGAPRAASHATSRTPESPVLAGDQGDPRS